MVLGADGKEIHLGYVEVTADCRPCKLRPVQLLPTISLSRRFQSCDISGTRD
jgi:hypothetical protein